MINSENIYLEKSQQLGLKNVRTESALYNPISEQYIISGWQRFYIHTKLKLTLIRIAINAYRNPIDWVRALLYLVRLRRRFLGDFRLRKMVKAGKKYYMGLYIPGWNSTVYRDFIRSELAQFKPTKKKINRFNMVIIAITKKCALQCDHCFEWDNLNKKDTLTPTKIIDIVETIQDKGVSQIQFSGGEPLLKMDTLINVLDEANKKITDFWVDTSGFKLTSNNAQKLKNAGLTGVIISLDHFIPEKHNNFRGFDKAYYWVEEAIKNSVENGLVTALSLCVTKDFISKGNLTQYMDLAKNIKVSFVQLLEPKAVGHYAGKDVALNQDQIQLLEEFLLMMNFDPKYKAYPLITYHGFYQRRQGCFSAGNKAMYIDTDGDMNPCPFCHKKTGNVLDDNFEHNLEVLQSSGCESFKINAN
jgi:MoaA/NifB/PqqE/SkfB family radical SAM enzyme